MSSEPLDDRPPFVPFDEQQAVRIYKRNLPHWRQAGATYFVTFRLGDSIPRGVLREWEYEQQAWLRARGISLAGVGHEWRKSLRQLSPSQTRAFRKHFGRKMHEYLDRGTGQCYLNDRPCIEIVRDRLLLGDRTDYELGDFVIMPNHAHLLITPACGQELEGILKNIKGSTAVYCNRILQRQERFWQPDSYDHIVRSLEELLIFRNYIADNPRRAGISVIPAAYYRAAWMDEWFLG